MSEKSIATLKAINEGGGKDLPIADDLTAVLKAAEPAAKACNKSSNDLEALGECLSGALTKAAAAAPNDTQKKLIALLGSYQAAIAKCAAGAAAARGGCSGAAIKQVFNQLVPLLVG
jgi:hypothetical protein